MASPIDNRPALFSLNSHRLKIALLLGFGIAAFMCMRADLNMAVVCMVNTTSFRAQLSEVTNVDKPEGKCIKNEEGIATKGYNGTLDWTPQMQASLLSATFYGSLFTIALSGSIAGRFGPKLILSVGCVIYVFVTMATPFLAEFSFKFLFTARLIMGLAEGFVMPSVGSMAGRWFPPAERSTLAGIYTSGSQLGAASSSLISALLCSSPLGWQSIFYFFGKYSLGSLVLLSRGSGTLGAIWIIFWFTLASNTPGTNKYIHKEELKYLESEIRRKDSTKSIPWRSLLTSKPIYACLFVHFAFNFSSTLMQTFLPTYFRDELMIPLSTNGAYTMIPFMVQIFMRTACAMVADSLKRKGILGATACSKMFQTLCAAGLATSLISLAVLPSCDRPWIAAACLAFYGIFYSFAIPGFFTALMSIAPQYSGTLTSMTMLSATLASITSPLVVTLLMTLRSQHIWQIMFIFTAILNIVGGGIFLIFGDAEVQEWAKPKKVSSVDAEGTMNEEK